MACIVSTKMADTNSLLAEVSSYLSQREDLRKRLADERAQVVAHLKRLDDALAKLSESAAMGAPTITTGRPSEAPTPTPAPSFDAKTASLPETILHIVRTQGRPMTSKEIIEALGDFRDTDAATVHSTLYRMSTPDNANAPLKSKGERGSKIYSAKKGTAQ